MSSASASALVELPRALAELPVDHERLFHEAAERISRLVGDLCVIAVRSDADRFEPVAVSHRDDEVRALVEEALRDGDLEPDSWPLASEALQRGEPLRVTEATGESLGGRINSWIRPYVERAEVRGILFLPVRARGRTIGLVTLAREGDSEPYSAEEESIVAAVVDRVALTLDNARLVRTLRRQAELDAALLAVQSDLGEGIAVLDLTTHRIVHANDALASLLGYRPAELERLGSFAELLPPEEGEDRVASLEERLGGEGRTGRRTLSLVRQDGARVEVEVATKRLESAAGNRLVALVRDVTERNRTEREVLLQAELLDQVDAAVSRVDDAGNIVHWNRGAERLYGWSQAEAVGRRAQDLLLPQHELDRSAEVGEAIAEGGVYEGEFTIVRRDGTTVPVDMRVARANGEGFVTVAVDASARRRTQRELEESREKFRAQYKGLPLPTYTWKRQDEDFILTDYNDAADRFSEGHVEGFLGHRASEVYGHDPLILAELKEALVARGSVSRELDFPMPSIHQTKRLAFTYVYVPPDLVMVHTEDVTARRKAEADLRFQAELLDQVDAAIVAADLGGTVTHWNRGAEELFGRAARDTVGESVSAVASTLEIEDRGMLLNRIRSGGSWDAELRLWRDGRSIPVYTRAVLVSDEGGRNVGYVGISVDISDRQQAEEALREAEERYRMLVERLPAITYVGEIGPEGAWRYISPQLETMLGYSPEEWKGDPGLWVRQLHADDRESVLAALARSAATGEPVALEYRIAAKGGDVRWIRHEAVVRRDADGLPARTEGILSDITERKRFETQLQFLADHDALTELYNRRRFLEELAREVRLVEREQGAACVLMLDIDNFKYVNDSLGHQAGDSLIRSVAGVLRRRVRAADTLARLGGDEFAILLRGTTAREGSRVANELLEAIRDRWHPVAAEPVRVTASIGLAELEGGSTAEGALAAADLAMYEAKQNGRDRFAVFSHELQARVQAGRTLTEQIRGALEADRFLLYGQPVLDLHTEQIAQHELLIRMRGEDGEIVPPGSFLPTAERFDLIQGIDRWVLGQALDLIAERDGGEHPVRIAVNLSGRSIGDPTLAGYLETELERRSIDPDALVLEVTETDAIANMDRAREFADRVSRLGCRVALDDFGSGFGSFYYLKHLPVHYLKIDGDLVRKLVTGRLDQEVVKAIVRLAETVGTFTMAEYVGDEATLELLREFGVDYAQGYHVGRPRPLAELRN